VAAITRTSARTVLEEPTGSKLRSWMHPQQLDLQVRAHVPDLVEEDRAAVGQR
jgi:hypothetical protein